MKTRKQFAEGDSVEFIRDTTHGRVWERGVYVSVDRVIPGWHTVKSVDGLKFFVPSRRLRAINGAR